MVEYFRVYQHVGFSLPALARDGRNRQGCTVGRHRTLVSTPRTDQMSQTLQVLFRRDPSRDRQDQQIRYEGYEVLWPDGRPLGIGFDAFCKQGQRLFGLNRQLAVHPECLVELACFPRQGREDELVRLPEHRVRRFFLERQSHQGRLHFFDGTPTAIVLDLDRDEWPVLSWIGLPGMRDGERQWMDLAARTLAPGQPQRPVLPPAPDGLL
jgi:hypothetical protein